MAWSCLYALVYGYVRGQSASVAFKGQSHLGVTKHAPQPGPVAQPLQRKAQKSRILKSLLCNALTLTAYGDDPSSLIPTGQWMVMFSWLS